MITLNLDESQTRALRKALDIYLSELRAEISDTQRGDFRDTLKEEEQRLKEILALLPGGD